MGNQQERSHFNIGYLLGILDGEGAYQLSPDKKYYSPMITISNTDINIINQIVETLSFLGIKHHVWFPKKHGQERLNSTRVYVRGIKNVKEATDILLKYPSAKFERAKLLNDFCIHRINVTKRGGTINQFDTRYSQIEIQFKERLRLLNSKYKGAKSSETIRLALARDEDIVQPHTKV